MSEENELKNNDKNEEDVVFDTDDSEVEFEDISGDDQTKIVKLKAKLKSALKEKDEYLSGWQRCRADFVNAKKTSENERLGLVDSVGEAFMKDILPVLDTFDLAFSQSSNVEASVESWRTGFLGIYSKMLEILGRRGLKQIGKVGDKFDVREVEPVMAVPVDKEELDDVVTEVLQKGYTLNDKVIRPVKVRVGQYEKLV